MRRIGRHAALVAVLVVLMQATLVAAAHATASARVAACCATVCHHARPVNGRCCCARVEAPDTALIPSAWHPAPLLGLAGAPAAELSHPDAGRVIRVHAAHARSAPLFLLTHSLRL